MKIRKYILTALLMGLICLCFVKPVNAESSYVLPYPSSMPGSIFYKLHKVEEFLLKYWYYGDFGQFDYNLKESDRYLVEAKTLFEYRQYLLGYKALEQSNSYFLKIKPCLFGASRNNKNISEKQNIFNDATLKHIEVLTKMQKETPAAFLWKPEKNNPQELLISNLITQSIKLRENEKNNL